MGSIQEEPNKTLIELIKNATDINEIAQFLQPTHLNVLKQILLNTYTIPLRQVMQERPPSPSYYVDVHENNDIPPIPSNDSENTMIFDSSGCSDMKQDASGSEMKYDSGRDLTVNSTSTVRAMRPITP
eukprot:246760_1